MFKPLACFVGLRYTRAKKSNHFISFISLSSMLGIALGVTVLITVLSVMNGFDHEIHHRFFSMAPEITINDYSGKLTDWPALSKKVAKYPGVVGVSPYVGGQGLMTLHGQVVPVLVTGIQPALESAVTRLSDKMMLGRLDGLKPGGFGIILGKQLANRLAVLPGEKVTLMIPKANVTLAGMVPRFKRFSVEGIFSAGTGFNFDSQLAFIDLKDGQTLFQMGDAVTGLKLKLDNVYSAPATSEALEKMLGNHYQVSNWTQQYGAFFSAVKMEKTMMFMILILIIAVAAFNLVSSLVMVVSDKQAEIAILRTLGAEPKTILSIFMVQGIFVGVIGTVLGVVGGVLLSWNATAIVDGLQQLFNVKLLSSNVYFVDYLPSQLQWHDVINVCCVAMVMSFLATLYPAWRASKTQPAEALRYE